MTMSQPMKTRKEELLAALLLASGDTKILVGHIEDFASFISQGKTPTPGPGPSGGPLDRAVLLALAELHKRVAAVLRDIAIVNEKGAAVIEPAGQLSRAE
jgi:hypothetical protein